MGKGSLRIEGRRKNPYLVAHTRLNHRIEVKTTSKQKAEGVVR